MKRQSAFTDAKKMLKGALHCHTTRSDGADSPEAVLRYLKTKDYDFVSLTDHRKYNLKNYAEDTGITLVPGMEYDNTFYADRGFRTYHEVCIGPDDGTNGFAQDEEFDHGHAKNQEEFQEILDMLHRNNNLTIYCHPEWSGTPARYFEKLRGNFAMEIWNSGCVLENDMDTNAAYWDELLGQGIKIFGVASDDAHNMSQYAHGWVMVNAQDNSVRAILNALEKGSFYASTGPVIKDFFVDDSNVVHVETDGCSKIYAISERHPSRMAAGDNLTHAEIKIDDTYDYVRVCVMDKDGRRAWTNPIFFDGRE